MNIYSKQWNCHFISLRLSLILLSPVSCEPQGLKHIRTKQSTSQQGFSLERLTVSTNIRYALLIG